MKYGTAILLVGLALLFAASASAHHSFSMYDSTKLLKLEGTVKQFQWTNPHVMMWLTKSADPAGEVWTIELPTSPGNLARMSWNKRSLKPGDHVVVELNPLRDGQHGGSFKKLTFVETGVVLVASVPGAPGTPGGPETDAGVAAAVTPSAPPTAAPVAASQAELVADRGPVVEPTRQTGGCACDVMQTKSGALWMLLGLGSLLQRRRRLSVQA